MRVAIYDDTSAPDQNLELVEFCKIQGFELVDSYIDDGVSETKELYRLRGDAIRRRFDAVLVWKIARFGRSLKQFLLYTGELKDVGVSFVSYKESLDLSTSTGQLMFNLFAIMAQYERRTGPSAED